MEKHLRDAKGAKYSPLNINSNRETSLIILVPWSYPAYIAY